MLVLSRKPGERIQIGPPAGGGPTITVTVVRIGRDNVRLGIEAPRGVPIHREEVLARIAAGESPNDEARMTKEARSPKPEPAEPEAA